MPGISLKRYLWESAREEDEGQPAGRGRAAVGAPPLGREEGRDGSDARDALAKVRPPDRLCEDGRDVEHLELGRLGRPLVLRDRVGHDHLFEARVLDDLVRRGVVVGRRGERTSVWPPSVLRERPRKSEERERGGRRRYAQRWPFR